MQKAPIPIAPSPQPHSHTPHACEHDATASSEHQLGRDDPLWPRYVEEAEKWDDIMMQKWNSSMDVLLLFATLFSAILTAFLIKTSETLEPDNSKIALTVLLEIAATLKDPPGSNETRQGNAQELPSIDKFEPNPSDVVVNLAWFISLCLSITVALIASLVKQWCNSFVSDRTAPPCTQARIRQARLDKLIRWRTEMIISALPVMMHVALGLFLFGLVVFLRHLHRDIYITAFVITIATAGFYIGTTISPYLISFCPYETPLTSRKSWGYLYQWTLSTTLYVLGWLFGIKSTADFSNRMFPSQQQELMVSRNTSPDDVTGHALGWIITHSQIPATRELAIRAISMLKSGETLQQLVACSPGVFPQVIQSFTSCFSVNFQGGQLGFNKDIHVISLHAQALCILANQVGLASDYSDLEYLATYGVDTDTIEAVEKRLQLLTTNAECTNGRILGLVSLSAWYEFAQRDKNLRFNCGDVILRLTRNLNWMLPANIQFGILRALLIESSYWTPDIRVQDRDEILRLLAGLLSTVPYQMRPQLACAVATLMLSVNQSTTCLRPIPNNCQDSLEPATGNSLARLLSVHYASDPEAIDGDELPLLLLALVGLMEHYAHSDLDDYTQESAMIVAKQLSTLSIFDKHQPITLADPLLHSDLREYVIEVLASWLRRAYTIPHSTSIDRIIVCLLQVIRRKRYFWVGHGTLLVQPIARILSQDSISPELQNLCLGACVYHLELAPSTTCIPMLFSFDIPFKLVQAVGNTAQHPYELPLRQDAARAFQIIAEKLQEWKRLQTTGLRLACTSISKSLLELTQKILQQQLVYVFIRYILNPDIDSANGSFWETRLVQTLENKDLALDSECLYETYQYITRLSKRKIRKISLLAQNQAPEPTVIYLRVAATCMYK